MFSRRKVFQFCSNFWSSTQASKNKTKNRHHSKFANAFHIIIHAHDSSSPISSPYIQKLLVTGTTVCPQTIWKVAVIIPDWLTRPTTAHQTYSRVTPTRFPCFCFFEMLLNLLEELDQWSIGIITLFPKSSVLSFPDGTNNPCVPRLCACQERLPPYTY